MRTAVDRGCDGLWHGHHGTTLGCLRALDRWRGRVCWAKRGRHWLWNGCSGHGGSAHLANPVIASDIDEVAVDVARANAANDLTDRVMCVEAEGFDHPTLMMQPF